MTRKAFILAEVFPTHCADNRRDAFTLAEVLITLGIIGVVAAMTMPTLLNSTQGAQYRTAYKKALSVLSQAVVLNIALDDYDTEQTTSTVTDGTSASLYNLFNNRMNVAKVCDGSVDCTADSANGWVSDKVDFGDESEAAAAAAEEEGDGAAAAATDDFDKTQAKFGGNAANSYTFFFNDGITLVFGKNAKQCSKANPCMAYIDVNGKKNPNKIVVCDGGNQNKGKAKDGEAGGNEACTVSNPTDIYPIKIYEQTIEPASEAAKQVMYGGK